MDTDLITIATTAALTQFVGPTFKNLGEQALERAKQVASKAAAQLKAVGREPQPVEPKILLPLMQAASLETDRTLAEKWAALLANAADPAQLVLVQPGFADILRQLPLYEVLLISQISEAPRTLASDTFAGSVISIGAIQHSIGNKIPEKLFRVVLDNLMRLRLCRGFSVLPSVTASRAFDPMTKTTVSSHDLLAEDKYVALTDLGLAFLAAVTPPTP